MPRTGRLAVIALAMGCSLTMPRPKPCTEDAACERAFGLGATCGEEGWCELPQVITGPITKDTLWEAGKPWVLEGVVQVEDAILVLEEGTTVLGRPGSALVVANTGQLVAQGRPDAPIVFSSASPPGERKPGNWGGLVLYGRARVAGGTYSSEKLPEPLEYGGPDDAHSCGRLEYLRVEFAGAALIEEENLPGLTLAGCGANTVVENVQIHRTADDGFELSGGSANFKRVVVTAAADDALTYELGWRGRGQFLMVQQYPDGYGGGDAALSGDGVLGEVELQSSPQLYNVSLLGSADTPTEQMGLNLGEQTAGTIGNLLIAYPTLAAVNLEVSETVQQVESGALRIHNALLWQSGPGGTAWSPVQDDDDNGFDETAWLQAEPTIWLDVDPGVEPPPAAEVIPWLTERDTAARWIPPLGSPAEDGAPVPSDGFFEPASYIGASKPGDNPWWANWTSFSTE